MKTKKKQTKEKLTFRMVGINNDKIYYKEVKSLFDYLEERGYKVIFIKGENNWRIEFTK